MSGATSWSIVFPLRDRCRIASEQDGDEVLLRGDRLFDAGNRGQRLLVLRPDLRHFRLRHDARPEPQVEQPRRRAEIARRRLCDLELAIERAHPDIARRNARHQRQHHAALCLLARIHLRLRGFGQATHPSEQVELPRGSQRCLVQREVRVGGRRDGRHAEAARTKATDVGVVADLRKQLRARRRQRTEELIDPCGGDAHVAVIAQRGLDQLVEDRVAELLPPFRVCNVGRLRIIDAPCIRCIDRWPHVVRSDGTAREHGGRNERNERTSLHLELLPAVDGGITLRRICSRRTQSVQLTSVTCDHRAPHSR